MRPDPNSNCADADIRAFMESVLRKLDGITDELRAVKVELEKTRWALPEATRFEPSPSRPDTAPCPPTDPSELVLSPIFAKWLAQQSIVDLEARLPGGLPPEKGASE